MDIFARIKRLVISRKVLFTEKAADEMRNDDLTREDVYEAILNAPCIRKVLSSRNPTTLAREKLYVILGMTFDGIDVYTKGKILKRLGEEVFYVLISSKRSTEV